MANKCQRKIVMVGGGSYHWCPRLLSDLIQTDALEGSEVVLLDVNLSAAEEVAAAARRMLAASGRCFQVWPTRSEPAAFRDADFVIITISTGGLKSMAPDLAIPEKYGIFQTVGDTVGPGGWSRALRNVPVFVHLARQIEKFAPRAVVLNYTNPLAVLTATLHRSSRPRTVGLCHGVFETYRVLERLLSVDQKDLALRFGGVNHFFWVLDFTVRGEPGYPLLQARLGKRTLDEAIKEGTVDAMGFHSHHLLADELYRRYGYLTYVADRHTCEFFPGYITGSSAVLGRFKLVRTSIADRRAGLRRARQVTLELAQGKRPIFPRSRETAVDIMAAIARGQGFCDVVNLPNVGQIDNLPRGAVVETLGLIDGLGFRPVTVGPLPPALQSLLAPHCLCQQMTLEAALAGDRKLALEALMADPVCGHLTAAQVRSMGKELMSATREWLVQFK